MVESLELNLNDIDLRDIGLNAAECHMDEYERNPYSRDRWVYLHIAETNLIGAKQQGADPERLKQLKERLEGYRLEIITEETHK